MSYVIAQPCTGVCEADCVAVCPIECIHGPAALVTLAKGPPAAMRAAGLQRFIHPGDCIECGACQSVCPVDAVFQEDDLPAEWAEYRERAARFFGLT